MGWEGRFGKEFHSILARWRNHFSQLFNVHSISDVRQTYMHTPEPLVPEPSAFEVELAVETLKRHKSHELIKFQKNWLKQGIEQFDLRSIKVLIRFGIGRKCLRSGRSRSFSTTDYILHSSNTWETIGTQWNSASAYKRLQERSCIIFSASLVTPQNT